jgi:DNA-binding response OmpR family regulator
VGDKERCLEAGMDGYTSKPLQINELFATIESVLHPTESNNAPRQPLTDSAIAKPE